MTISRWINNPERKKYVRKAIPLSVQIIETICVAIKSDPFISSEL